MTLSGSMEAQDVMLDMNVEDQYKATRGPNMRHYGQIYVGLGVVPDFDEEEGTAIKWWRSGQFMVGYRYKLKLLSFYAIGLDFSFKTTQYFFEDRDNNPFDEMNPLTYNQERDKHQLVNNGFGLEFYHRINFGRRGNTLGKYLDTGIRAQWNFANVEKILLKTDDDGVPSKRIKIENRKLTFIEPLSYGLTARIGFNKFLIHANYRLSDYFKNKISDDVAVEIPELPRLAVGLQVAF